MGAEFPRCRRPDPDLQYPERHDPRHPQGLHLSQAARARHPASARYAADEVRHLPRLCAVHDRGAAAARHRRAFRVGLSVHPRRPRHGYVGGGSTHAWVQVYLPSAGWIEFDPTNGIVGTRDLVRVAVARDPRQAIPLHGTYLGSADAFVGMDVSINVVSAGEEARGVDHGNQGRLRDRLRRGAADADGDHAQHSPLALSDIVGTETIVAEPTCRSDFIATALAMSAAGWWRRPAASRCAAARWCAIPDCLTW